MTYIIGLTLTCFLILLLFLKKEKQKADFLLLGWLAILVVHIFLSYVQYTEIAYKYPHTLGLGFSLPLLHGLFIYVYASELTGSSILKNKTIFFHLLPFIFLTILAIPFYSLPASKKIAVFQHQGQGFEWYTTTQLILISISGLAYSVATLLKIKKYRIKLLHHFSNTEKKKLEWVEYSAIGLGVIWIVAVFFNDPIIFVAVTIFVLLIGVFGINQTTVFSSEITIAPVAESEKPTEIVPEQQKYIRTGLGNEEAEKLMIDLDALMQTKKPFTNSELTLKDLAGMLQCSPNHLSQIINTKYGNTFYHYINSLRLKEFIEQASFPENKKFTFLAIAYDCGFNSKTTFNKYFKLETGKTPTEYFE